MEAIYFATIESASGIISDRKLHKENGASLSDFNKWLSTVRSELEMRNRMTFTITSINFITIPNRDSNQKTDNHD